VYVSDVGSDLKVVGNIEGGFSCTMSIVARLSHTAVSCFCEATHINSSKGPGESERIVRSVGSEVIALNNSLNACKYVRYTRDSYRKAALHS
jgi:hypothetical protein